LDGKNDGLEGCRHMMFGIHYSVIINNIKGVGLLSFSEELVKVAQLIGATVLKSYSHIFNPPGESGISLLSESHHAFHYWPDQETIVASFHTCGNIDSLEAIKAFAHAIGGEITQIVFHNYDTRKYGEINIATL
jgi:S-adenosylmethionine/arginine decarboxylase-like enzyme